MTPLQMMLTSAIAALINVTPNAAARTAVKLIRDVAAELAVDVKAVFEATAAAASFTFTEGAIADAVNRIFPESVPDALSHLVSPPPPPPAPPEPPPAPPE